MTRGGGEDPLRDIFSFTLSAFRAAGFSEAEQHAWLVLGLSCTEAVAARGRGLTPTAVAAMAPGARAAWFRRLRAQARG